MERKAELIVFTPTRREVTKQCKDPIGRVVFEMEMTRFRDSLKEDGKPVSGREIFSVYVTDVAEGDENTYIKAGNTIYQVPSTIFAGKAN